MMEFKQWPRLGPIPLAVAALLGPVASGAHADAIQDLQAQVQGG